MTNYEECCKTIQGLDGMDTSYQGQCSALIGTQQMLDTRIMPVTSTIQLTVASYPEAPRKILKWPSDWLEIILFCAGFMGTLKVEK